MAGELPLFGPALQLLALVVQLLRFGERDRDLGDAVLEVQLERDDGEALTARAADRSEEHTSELQSLAYLVCRLLLEKKKKINKKLHYTVYNIQIKLVIYH